MVSEAGHPETDELWISSWNEAYAGSAIGDLASCSSQSSSKVEKQCKKTQKAIGRPQYNVHHIIRIQKLILHYVTGRI